MQKSEPWTFRAAGQSEASKTYRGIMRRFTDVKEDALCSNKEACKQFLNGHGFLTPKTYHIIDKYPTDPQLLFQVPSNFIIKPYNQWNGHGVFIIERCGERFIEPDGREHSAGELMAELGRPSLSRFFIVEEKIVPHKELARLSPYGTLSDFRICFVNRKWFLTALRIPTKESRGYGNVHRGALPVMIGEDGKVASVPYCLSRCAVHPDSGEDLEGMRVPSWDSALEEVSRIPALFKSSVVSVDGCINEEGRFVVIELTLLPFFYWLTEDGLKKILELSGATSESKS